MSKYIVVDLFSMYQNYPLKGKISTFIGRRSKMVSDYKRLFIFAGFFLISLSFLVTLCSAGWIHGTIKNMHLYETSIDNNYNSPGITYTLSVPPGADLDLFIFDEYTETWYDSSSNTNAVEMLTVPGVSGYKHWLYVYAYSGSGEWTVSSPDIKWVDGSFYDKGIWTQAEIDQLKETNLNED